MSPQSSPPDLENYWREQLVAAITRYKATMNEVLSLLEQESVGSVRVAAALREEALAQDEYLKILKIFTDLVVYGQPPGAGETSGGLSGSPSP